jgi:D-aminopeptidase
VPPPPPRRRARELGIRIGFLEPGPTNSIVDVAGVLVGHATVWRDEPEPPIGRGCARTGITAVVPFGLSEVYRDPLPAAVDVLNGAGELTGSITLAEWGALETPIVLTATMQVGRAYDGVVAALCAAEPSCGTDRVVIPVVGECDDSWLNDARRVQIAESDVRAALSAASARPPAEGAVGAGTGMICCGWKGGIGTSSRRVADGSTVGVLLLTNWGEAHRFVVDGVPVGRTLRPRDVAPPRPAGSCIGVVATDAACGPNDLRRLARRVGLGLARSGSTAHHGSGEIFCAFSTTRASGRPELDPLFAAVVEATEEAVLNSVFVADAVVGRDDRVGEALPVEAAIELLRAAGRLHVE